MRISINSNDKASWLNWGNLVMSWINGSVRPTTVWQLKDQLTGAGVHAIVDGTDDRIVTVVDYEDDPTAALVIAIPSKTMLAAKFAQIKAGPYTLMPQWYDEAWGWVPRSPMTLTDAQNFGIMRVGEYSIQECC
ncbi:MAG TPA: hypothetical protein VL993_07010 [Stellaceae bacterium]|nr:hypothetical protein [Stellaceae bacterium]